ncbi:unnamed protein product [Clonostachys byssicola]|uniref:S-adenosyl-L-methionine-dependent methyltransferase n=1 Tax=Clonostachys byssicola TaxID=160290 RepID=A0A9N9UI06_9HYPO|nr:unnamed protein product [Clonostachys byssicola]
MATQQRLLSHFADRNGSERQNSGWAELWDTDQSDLWDRGTPSAALIDWVESHPDQLQSLSGLHRPRALVPGCGKGYDVAMLALHGFDVVGLELSPRGAQVATSYAEAELAEPHDYNFGEQNDTPDGGIGSVNIITADFFDKSWSQNEAESSGQKFDLIYDYTFLCALHPDMRQSWAQRMLELLSPSGILICLEFPLFKELHELGPPWPLQGVYWNLLAQGGDGKVDGHNGDISDDAPVSAIGPFVRTSRFKPERSYPNGKGTDMVSIWRRK